MTGPDQLFPDPKNLLYQLIRKCLSRWAAPGQCRESKPTGLAGLSPPPPTSPEYLLAVAVGLADIAEELEGLLGGYAG